MRAIDLGNLESRYLDFSGDKYVKFTGKYIGDRIVIKGASGTTLYMSGATIESTRKEADGDALVFAEDLENFTLIGGSGKIIFGGLTFWGKLTGVTIQDLEIYYANVGIRASQDFANEHVKITGCKIIAPRREGIYFGPHYAQEHKSRHLVIANNTLRYCGWDGIQVNAYLAEIYGNDIDQAGVLAERYQKYAITIQPGSTVYEYDNTITESDYKIQVLESRYFNHAPG